MSEADAACCPACQARVNLRHIASMADWDRYICCNCKASIQRTSEFNMGRGIWLLFPCLLIAQLARFNLWALLLFLPIIVLAGFRERRAMRLITFKLSEPWSLRA